MINQFIKSKISVVIVIVLVWAIGIYTLSFWGTKILSTPGICESALCSGKFAAIDHWYSFDAAFYLGIDTDGYKDNPPVDSIWGNNYVRAAFFPAFPLIGKVVSYPLKLISISLKQSLMFTNLILTLGASIFIYKMAYLLKKDEDYALKTLIYFLVFPFSFFLLAPYSEASLVFFSAGIFYFLLQKKYLYAALMGIGATMARIIGVVFPLIIFLFFLEQNNWNFKKINFKIILTCLIPLLGVGAYMLFLKHTFNDYLYFIKMQEIWRTNVGFNFLQTLWTYLKELKGFDYKNINEVGSALLFLILGIIAWIKLKHKTFAIFIFISLLIPLFTGSFFSINRFVIPIIPAFLVLGLGYKNKVFDFGYLFVATLFLSLFTVMFTHGMWVG